MKAVGLALLALLAPLAACGGSDATTLHVFAAASLTESFEAIAEEFESRHPDTRVELNLGPSSGLAEQVLGGAPADVYAAASPDTMAQLVAEGAAEEPQDFATNRMQVVVPSSNPGKVDSLADLGRADLKVALCQPQVPCGQVAARVFANAGITVRPVTEEVDVKGVLTKVELGEVDAGLVYATDVLAAGDRVRGVEIAEDQNASTTYPVATLTDARHPRTARQFVDLVLSETGARVLADAGFGRP